MVGRRELLFAAASCLAAPGRLLAQATTKTVRIGALDDSDRNARASYWQVFRQRLRELGYFEGKNLVIDTRWAEGDQDRLPALAADLVRLRPDVIVSTGTPPTRAAMLATSAIPIIFTDSADPIKAELVASLARPTGNVTGLSIMSTSIVGKWIEFLRELKPGVSKVAFLGPATNAGTVAVMRQLQQEAKLRGLSVDLIDAHNAPEIDNAFQLIDAGNFDALVVTATASLLPHQNQIVSLAAQRRLVALYARQEYCEAGGLMSYGTDFSVLFRRAAEHVDRILHGAKPSEIPVEQPLSLKLFVNVKTARTLGIKIPQSILVRADRVLE